MLRWTKGSSAAHGVLAIFLLLLSASQGIPIVEDQEVEVRTEQPTETTAATTTISAPSGRRIRDFAWKSDLARPCPTPNLSGSGYRRRQMIPEGRKLVYQGINERFLFVLQLAQDMLNSSLVPDCSHLTIQPVESNPTLEDLQDKNETEAVKTMYASILRSTAYAFFIRDQLETTTETQCLNSSVQAKVQWTELKNHMKFMACIFHELIPDNADRTNYFSDVTHDVMDETLSDQSICSRKLNQHCQMLKSIIHVLEVVSEYSSQASSGR